MPTQSKAYLLVLTALLTTLCIISAKIAIPLPFTAVLFTPQVLVVLLCGLVLGPSWGQLAIGCYLLLGLIGLPVFSKGGGLGYVMEPSFGYALGFLPAVWLAGLLRDKVWPSLACAVGVCGMYAVALGYIAVLGMLLGNVLPSLGAFLTVYFAAFFPLDLVKGVLAAMLYQLLKRRKLLPVTQKTIRPPAQ